MKEGSKNRNKTLRITISRDGKDIKEIFTNESITIGNSLDNDIVIKSWKLRDHFPIVEVKSNTSCILNIHESMEGFISKGTTSQSLKDLVALNLLPKKDDCYQVSFDTQNVGNIRFGNICLKFDYTIPPPSTEAEISIKELLAYKEVSKKVVMEEERKFAYIMLGSFVAHLLFVIYAYNASPPKKRTVIAGLPPVIAELVEMDITAPSEVGTGEEKT
ncbi:MAG: hypothetical protein DRH44_07290, partial [Candidatus Coatesbacteria bacterium]